MAIKNPKFLVRSIGRELVRKTQRKNVHAFVIGYLENFVGLRAVSGDRVTYDPYKNDSFIYWDTGNPVKKSKYADFFFSAKGKAIIKVER